MGDFSREFRDPAWHLGCSTGRRRVKSPGPPPRRSAGATKLASHNLPCGCRESPNRPPCLAFPACRFGVASSPYAPRRRSSRSAQESDAPTSKTQPKRAKNQTREAWHSRCSIHRQHTAPVFHWSNRPTMTSCLMGAGSVFRDLPDRLLTRRFISTTSTAPAVSLAARGPSRS
jgi:hypothetical protein